jgi:hypothetical protein
MTGIVHLSEGSVVEMMLLTISGSISSAMAIYFPEIVDHYLMGDKLTRQPASKKVRDIVL